MAAPGEHPPAERAKPLLGLLHGIAQTAYYGNAEITEELLREQLYPETAPQEFGVLLAKMTGIVKSLASADMDSNQLEAFLTAQTKKPGGITADQATGIAKFWKNHRVKIRESLIDQSKWENSLKSLNWRVDLKSQSRIGDQLNSPVAIVEMELGKNGQSWKRQQRPCRNTHQSTPNRWPIQPLLKKPPKKTTPPVSKAAYSSAGQL